MGINETLDRLKREREMRELEETEQEIRQEPETASCEREKRIRVYAKRIFFDRMLKDINHGMGAAKIDGLIDRSVMIATRLVDKLYKQ